MNIGIPGRTSHDFENRYDKSNETIVWYGKPKSHSGQPTFQKIISGELTPHFFARWATRDPFTYLGVGNYVSHTNGAQATGSDGQPIDTIEVKLTCRNATEIISYSEDKHEAIESTFALEKHLEDFLIHNWTHTVLGKQYDIHQKDGEVDGRQLSTEIGRIDILAVSKDKNTFLVIELKRGRASDPVLGQIQRYMGWVNKNLATKGEKVIGRIVGLEDDLQLQHALTVAPDVEFMRYEIKFDLVGSC
jgi:restriction system protein